MFANLALALIMHFAPFTANTAHTANGRFGLPDCETVGPRLDGSMVHICNGSVTHVFMLGQVAPAGVSVVTFDGQEDADTFAHDRE